MNLDVRRALMDLDVPAERIQAEFFGAPPQDDGEPVRGVPSRLTAQLHGARHEVTIPEGRTVLEALLHEGVDISFSCQSGLCGACKGRLRQGTVHQRAPLGLEEADISKGWILTCQSVATSSKLWVEVG